MSRFFCLLCLTLVQVATSAAFTLSILHTNDMHARFEQTNQMSSKCSSKDAAANNCYGGFARVRQVVKEAKRKAREGAGPRVVFLNAGDTYQGTVWYTVHKWRVVAKLSSMLDIDASSLGNHEFDDGVAGLVPYINNVSFPVLASNLDLHQEPTLAATHLAKSVVLTVDDRKIGIIGYLTTDTPTMSSAGHVTFLDEVSSVRLEAARLKREGVDILIALGHAGYEMDKKIAEEVADVDVVVGGHTNTFLYSGNSPDPTDKVDGPYPTVVQQRSGKKVPVVQAYAYTKYVGNLTVTFDNYGELKSWMGNPILMDKKVPEDREVLRELDLWREAVRNQTRTKIGYTRVYLNGDQRYCRREECNLGNLIADSMIDYYVSRNAPIEGGWTDAPIALLHGGGVRASIDSTVDGGVVTSGDVLTSLPFDNTLMKLTLKGVHLVEALEKSVWGYDVYNRSGQGGFLQVAGIRVKFDVCRPPGKRVLSVFIRCGLCREPIYEPIDKNQVYGVILPSFLANGGDGHKFQEHLITSTSLDVSDFSTLEEYISKKSPVYPGVEGRITYEDINKCVKPDNTIPPRTNVAASVTIATSILTFSIALLTTVLLR